MLGISLLNEIVIKHESKQPSEILESMREGIKTSLKQTMQAGGSKDGIDIALCLIDIHTGAARYSGAYNPLYVIRDNELIEIKATRGSVGICRKEKPFTNHDIQSISRR